MSTTYPGELDDIPEGQDGITPINAALINSLVDPINAIEATLGINPQGIFPTVGDRLSVVVDISGGVSITSSQISPWDGATAPDSLSGSGIANQHIKAQAVSFDKLAPGLVVVGGTIIYPLQTPTSPIPVGWLATDGSLLSQSAFPALFAVIGNMFGAAPPGQFFLPNWSTGISNTVYIMRYQ